MERPFIINIQFLPFGIAVAFLVVFFVAAINHYHGETRIYRKF